eukprot:RCo033377
MACLPQCYAVLPLAPAPCVPVALQRFSSCVQAPSGIAEGTSLARAASALEFFDRTQVFCCGYSEVEVEFLPELLAEPLPCPLSLPALGSPCPLRLAQLYSSSCAPTISAGSFPCAAWAAPLMPSPHPPLRPHESLPFNGEHSPHFHSTQSAPALGASAPPAQPRPTDIARATSGPELPRRHSQRPIGAYSRAAATRLEAASTAVPVKRPTRFIPAGSISTSEDPAETFSTLHQAPRLKPSIPKERWSIVKDTELRRNGHHSLLSRLPLDCLDLVLDFVRSHRTVCPVCRLWKDLAHHRRVVVDTGAGEAPGGVEVQGL